MRKKYGSDLIQAYQQAKAKGYTRSYGCFKRTARRTLPPTKPPRKRKNKPYQRAAYPGEKVQVGLNPKFCVNSQRGENRSEFIVSGSGSIRLPLVCSITPAGMDVKGGGKAAVHRSAVQRRADP